MDISSGVLGRGTVLMVMLFVFNKATAQQFGKCFYQEWDEKTGTTLVFVQQRVSLTVNLTLSKYANPPTNTSKVGRWHIMVLPRSCVRPFLTIRRSIVSFRSAGWQVDQWVVGWRSVVRSQAPPALYAHVSLGKILNPKLPPMAVSCVNGLIETALPTGVWCERVCISDLYCRLERLKHFGWTNQLPAEVTSTSEDVFLFAFVCFLARLRRTYCCHVLVFWWKVWTHRIYFRDLNGKNTSHLFHKNVVSQGEWLVALYCHFSFVFTPNYTQLESGLVFLHKRVLFFKHCGQNFLPLLAPAQNELLYTRTLDILEEKRKRMLHFVGDTLPKPQELVVR